jgi:glycosyltransferase involved in cell wall biosynthesis
MRVLMVGPWRATAMRRHIDWARESGIDVCVADFFTPPESIRPRGVRVIDLLPRCMAGRRHSKSPFVLEVAELRLRYAAKAFQPDLVHAYMLNRYTDVCLRAAMRPLVVSVWGFLNRLLHHTPTPVDRRWLRRLKWGAHTLLVENPNLLNVLGDRSVQPLQLACFPIGVDGSLFHPDYHEKRSAWRFVLDIPDDATVLLSPRGWSNTYGQPQIMRAFAQAYHQLDTPLVMVLLGVGRMKRPETLAQEVLDAARSMGVGQAIRWIPQVPYEDMPGIYALADIVVNYPRTDAFPSTLLEAAACARPVISSDLPAYRNTFVEQFWRLVEPENPAALAQAMVDMVINRNAAGWAERVEQARRAVLAEYEERNQKARLMALYQVIANERVR